VRDFPQKLNVEDVKMKLSCKTSLKRMNVEDVKMKLSSVVVVVKVVVVTVVGDSAGCDVLVVAAVP
jgi:uncharacterized membrane protein YqhA